jgi:predicted nuclease of predicted toxin-antitoxin system
VQFLLDEGLPYRLAAYLREEGHDVSVCGHDRPQAMADREIPAIANIERRIVLTNDKDFGDLVFRDRLPHAGVILFRLGYLPIDARIDILRRTLIDFQDHLAEFIVVTSTGIRVATGQS